MTPPAAAPERARPGGPRRAARWRELLLREAWRRALPHGVLTPLYLWPGDDARIRLHRDLWWRAGAGWPRGPWLLLQAGLWLRWVAWRGWWHALRAVRRFGPEVRERHGLSLVRQFARTCRIALGACIAPAEVYRFGLLQRPQGWPDYVYAHEARAFHAVRSASWGGPLAASLRQLQDKAALATLAAAHGIPVTTSWRIACGASSSLDAALGPLARAFCKANAGHQGRGAFAVWRTPAGLRGRSFEGRALDAAQLETAWRALLARDDVLVQPLLENHAALAPMGCDPALAITVRFISQREAARCGGLCAMLEVPVQGPADAALQYCIQPIALATGEIGPLPPPAVPLARAATQDAVLERAPADRRVPHWAALVRHSLQAHAAFPDLWAIAWDWVLTPAGPVLLEGNPGWDVAVPQLLLGGFAAPQALRTAPAAATASG